MTKPEKKPVGVSIEQLEKLATKRPEIRQERVERIRYLLQSSQYEVSNEQIAQAMMEELFPSGSHG